MQQFSGGKPGDPDGGHKILVSLEELNFNNKCSLTQQIRSTRHTYSSNKNYNNYSIPMTAYRQCAKPLNYIPADTDSTATITLWTSAIHINVINFYSVTNISCLVLRSLIHVIRTIQSVILRNIIPAVSRYIDFPFNNNCQRW